MLFKKTAFSIGFAVSALKMMPSSAMMKFMKKINADIKEHQFERVYLLYGNENFLKQSCKNRLKNAVAGEDTMNFMAVTGKEFDLTTLRDFTETMPFFAEKRMLIMEDSGIFKGSAEGFPEWIDALPESACVVFVESEIDKRSRVYKRVQDKGYVSEMNHPDDAMLEKWILQKIGARKLNITRDAFRRFLEITGNEMDTLNNEIEKLCDYCELNGNITIEDVELIVTPVVTSRVFELVEQVARGNHERSMELYYDLLSLKEPAMRILFLIARQLNQLVLIKDMLMQRKNRDEIARAMSLKPFIVSKLSDQAAGFTLQKLKDSIRLAVELEEAVKTGDLNETMAVEILINRMTVRG